VVWQLTSKPTGALRTGGGVILSWVFSKREVQFAFTVIREANNWPTDAS
jgi:hypothetical protein